MEEKEEAPAEQTAPDERREPHAGLLTVSGFELSAKKKEVLSWKWAAKRLEKSRQYWIATTRPDGTPHLMVIWGLWLDDSFWFSTGASSRKARNLAQNPKCVIGTGDAAEAVILEGSVELVDANDGSLEKFIAAYEKKYAWDVREMG